MKRRLFLGGSAALVGGAYLGVQSCSRSQDKEYDLIIVGGGNAGLPAAIHAAQRGARVLIVDAALTLGGTLLMSGGRMSAAGTKLQKQMGIEDTPDLHFEYVMELSKGTADPVLVRLAVDNAAPVFDWLMDNGLVLADDVPTAFGMTHEPQNRARYVWSKYKGIGIFEVLEKFLNPLIASGAITAQTETEVIGLTFDRNGAVTGVQARDRTGAILDFKGRSVALTSGGYASNPEMFEELEGAPDYSNVSNSYSQGIGITLGLSAGGFVRGGENHLPNFGWIPAEDKVPSASFGSAVHQPKNRLPWEIWVNENGKRFIREDETSIHKKELALIKQPHERLWMIFDEAMLQNSPPPVRRHSREEIFGLFDEGHMAFKKADRLDQLAAMTGINSQGLAETVRQYNASQTAGTDGLGREHMPAPISSGPFYAIRIQSGQVISFAGLAVDGQLRVVREDMTPIPNLYAAGELLGAGNLMGQCYAGGMLVTPALTFGRLLGKEIIPLNA